MERSRVKPHCERRDNNQLLLHVHYTHLSTLRQMRLSHGIINPHVNTAALFKNNMGLLQTNIVYTQMKKDHNFRDIGRNYRRALCQFR